MSVIGLKGLHVFFGHRFDFVFSDGAEKCHSLQSIKRMLNDSLLDFIYLSIEIVKVSFP